MTGLANENGSVKFDDFINPNSMITPGAAGATTMVITSVLTSEFAQMPENWTALIVSFLFGALTFFYAAQLLPRIIYFIINSLIIFVMAHGTNSIGLSVTNSANTTPSAELNVHHSTQLFGGSNMTLASITNKQARSMTFTGAKDDILVLVQADTNKTVNTDNNKKADTNKTVNTDKNKKKDSGFFRQWHW